MCHTVRPGARASAIVAPAGIAVFFPLRAVLALFADTMPKPAMHLAEFSVFFAAKPGLPVLADGDIG